MFLLVTLDNATMQPNSSESRPTEITVIVVIIALLILLPPMLGWW